GKRASIRRGRGESTVDDGRGLTRRGLLAAVGAGAAAVTIATVGETVTPLKPISALAPRHPTVGPAGLTINATAAGSGVVAAATDPAWRLRLSGPGGRRELSLAELAALPQRTVALPIACVEGWSATA